MSGRLSQLRDRLGKADGPPAQAPAVDQPTVVAPGQPTLFHDPAVQAQLPADVAPEVEGQPSFRDRGQYRRRLRYLRRVRELGFRDLGGLVFDLHRFGRSGDQLIAGKLEALSAVDRELRALERVLQDEQAFTDLREPGIAACARCGALHGSDARFCPSCGVSLTGPRTLSELPVASPQAPTAPVAQPVQPLAWSGAAADPSEQPTQLADVAPLPVTEGEPGTAPAAPTPAEPEAPADAAEPAAPEPEASSDATATDASAASPEPEAPAADEPEAGETPDPEVVVSAADSGDTPVSAAEHGLPVPPPPVPPAPDDAGRSS